MASVDFQNVTTHKHHVVKKRVLTLSEADKELREDVHTISYGSENNKPGFCFAHFFDDKGCYSFEIHNLRLSDVQMMLKIYPMLYNYLDDIPF